MPSKKPARASDDVLRELRAFGLAYPGAHTKSPWPGHLDLAVNDKTFAYLSLEGEPFHISCRLPHSSEFALMMDGCKPAAYGLGKWGWVAAEFADDKMPPIEVLKAWVDESYRNQAPKKLLKELTTPPLRMGDVIDAPAPSKKTAPKTAKAAAKTVVAKAKPARKSTKKPTAKSTPRSKK